MCKGMKGLGRWAAGLAVIIGMVMMAAVAVYLFWAPSFLPNSNALGMGRESGSLGGIFAALEASAQSVSYSLDVDAMRTQGTILAITVFVGGFCLALFGMLALRKPVADCDGSHPAVASMDMEEGKSYGSGDGGESNWATKGQVTGLKRDLAVLEKSVNVSAMN